jgi:hypothetical protein
MLGMPIPQAPMPGMSMPGMPIIPVMSMLGMQHDVSALGMLMPGIPIGMPMGGIPIGMLIPGIPIGDMPMPEPMSPPFCALAGNATPSAIVAASARAGNSRRISRLLIPTSGILYWQTMKAP